jgi:hypothetical protein
VKWAAVTSSSAILEARPPANASTSAELRITWKERQSLFFPDQRDARSVSKKKGRQVS